MANASFFSNDNVPASNWMKFETVGDGVKGTFKEKFNKEGDGKMPSQVVFVLTNAERTALEINANGDVEGVKESEAIDGDINVPVRDTNAFVLTRLKNIKPGDIIGFAFTKEIAPKQKGYSPAKSIVPFKSGVDEEYVKTLESVKESNDEISLDDIPFR